MIRMIKSMEELEDMSDEELEAYADMLESLEAEPDES